MCQLSLKNAKNVVSTLIEKLQISGGTKVTHTLHTTMLGSTASHLHYSPKECNVATVQHVPRSYLTPLLCSQTWTCSLECTPSNILTVPTLNLRAYSICKVSGITWLTGSLLGMTET